MTKLAAAILLALDHTDPPHPVRLLRACRE
jgi:hypothetical protein